MAMLHTTIAQVEVIVGKIRRRSELEARRLDGIRHVCSKVELLVIGRRSDAAVFLLLGTEVLLNDVKCFLVDLVILVVLQEFYFVQSCNSPHKFNKSIAQYNTKLWVQWSNW